MTNLDLKPCPFCGGEAEVYNILENEPELELVGLTKNNWEVFCPNCFGKGGTGRTAIEAIEAWNRRADNELCKKNETKK